MVDAAAAPHRVLLERAQARQGLAGVADPRTVPPTAVTHARVAVAMPDRCVTQVQRCALGREDPGRGPGDHEGGGSGHRGRSRRPPGDRICRSPPSSVSKTASATEPPASTPAGAGRHGGAARLVGRNGRAGSSRPGRRAGPRPARRESIAATPSASRPASASASRCAIDHAPVSIMRRCRSCASVDHASTGTAARSSTLARRRPSASRTPMDRAQRSARSGWSTRTWQPRDSARASAAVASAPAASAEVRGLDRSAGRAVQRPRAPARRPSAPFAALRRPGRCPRPRLIRACSSRRPDGGAATGTSASARPGSPTLSSRSAHDRGGGPLTHHQPLEE